MGFCAGLLEVLNIVDGVDQLELPVTWDAAHVLNLAVSGVKDSKTPSGTFFQRFVKRCNVFNTILAHGKGFAFLQLIDESARRPVAYATQRFLVPATSNGSKLRITTHLSGKRLKSCTQIELKRKSFNT